MKVLYVSGLYPPHIGGGAEIILKEIIDGFRGRGHAASVLTTHGESGQVIDSVDDIPVHRIGVKNIYWHFPPQKRSALQRTLWHAIDSNNFLQGRAVEKAIRELQPDVVVCHNLAGISIAAWAACVRQGVPVVQVLHDYYSLCPKVTMYRDDHVCATPCSGCSVFRSPHRRASQAVTAIVGVSQAILDTHLSNGLFSDAPIKAVVHNARELPPQPASQRGETFTVGFLGGLTSNKGIELLLQAFTTLAQRSARPVRLLVAGSGKKEEVERLKRDYASPQISFLGHVNAFEFLPKLDVAVIPSRWNDPFPGVVYEALAMGVPVIGARRGGIPEIVDHGVNGLLFDPDEADGLLRCLVQVMEKPGMLDAMRSVSRSSVAPLLDRGRVLDEYDGIYRRAMTARAAPRETTRTP